MARGSTIPGPALLVLDSTGTIEATNAVSDGLLGPVVGQTLRSLLRPDDGAAWDELLRHVNENGAADHACLHFEGSTMVGDKPLRIELLRVRRSDGDGRLVATVQPQLGVDTNAMRQIDPLVGALGDVCYVDEILPDGRHHNLYVSPRFEAFLGRPIPPGADALAIWRSAVHVEDRAVETAFMDAVARGERAEAEYRVLTPDGGTRRVVNRAWPRSEHGRLLVFGIVSELVGVRREEAEQRERQRRVAAVAEAVDDVLVQVSLPERGGPRLLYASPQVHALLRAHDDPGELLASASGAVHEDDRDGLERDLAALRRGESIDRRLRATTPDGRLRWLWVRARPARDESGLTVNAVVADVTHHGRPQPAADEGASFALTPRQREILELLADGISTKTIASDLGLSLRTVQNHVAAILRELSAHSRLEAVARARRSGLL